MRAHLVPLGRGRFDLYAEAPDADTGPPGKDAGRLRRWLHVAVEQWHAYVDQARLSTDTGRLARWRDAIIRNLADTLDEQRTLRGVRGADAVELCYPASTEPEAARRALDTILAAARRQHGRRFAVYLVLFVASGALAVLPGPNIVAYYFGFLAFGHLQAWRGARHASLTVRWTLLASPDLDALAALCGVASSVRAAEVAAIAERLGLDHLPAFFERAGR